MSDIDIIAIMKGGGTAPFKIPSSWLPKLAKSLQSGSEHLHTASRSVEIVGFMVIGRGVGEMIIVVGGESPNEATGQADEGISR